MYGYDAKSGAHTDSTFAALCKYSHIHVALSIPNCRSMTSHGEGSIRTRRSLRTTCELTVVPVV